MNESFNQLTSTSSLKSLKKYFLTIKIHDQSEKSMNHANMFNQTIAISDSKRRIQ